MPRGILLAVALTLGLPVGAAAQHDPAAATPERDTALEPAERTPVSPIERSAGEPSESLGVGGLTLAGAGLLTLGAAAVLAVLGADAGDRYAAAPTDEVAEVDAAYARLGEARDLTFTSDALFVAGGLVTAAGLLLAVLLPDHRPRAGDVAPVVGVAWLPGGGPTLHLALRGSWCAW